MRGDNSIISTPITYFDPINNSVMKKERVIKKTRSHTIECQNPECGYKKTPDTQLKCNFCGVPFDNPKPKAEKLPTDLIIKTIVKEFKKIGAYINERDCFIDDTDGSVCIPISREFHSFFEILVVLLRKYNLALCHLDLEGIETVMWFKDISDWNSL